MKTCFVRTAFAFTVCTLLGGSLAFAQATRTWVSGLGNDADPCSRTAPCKTYAGAISKTAAGGEISTLDPGGFGAVTITKSITISGVGTQASILGAGSNGIVINAGVNDVVVLHNLQINGVGTGLIGVRFLNGAALVMEDVRIWGFNVAVSAEAGKTSINRGEFTNNRQIAVHSLGAATLTLENSEVNANNIAVQADGTSTVRMSNNGFYDNQTGFACGTGSGILASAGNNRKAGNAGGAAPVCSPTVVITVQ